MELSFISRVIKTDFLIFLALKDKSSCFFSQDNPAGFSFFTFFRCFIFHLLSVFIFHLSQDITLYDIVILNFKQRATFSCEIYNIFRTSPFSGVFTFHLSQVFHFSPFSGIFVLLFLCYSQAFFTSHSFPKFVTVPQVLRIWESYFDSQAFFTLHSFPTFWLLSRLPSSPWQPAVLPWRLQGSIEVQNTNPAHL